MTAQAQAGAAPLEDVRGTSTRQHQLYSEAVAGHAAALGRLAHAYEADAERSRDLLQDIHVELWRSFAGFDGRCSRLTRLRIERGAPPDHLSDLRAPRLHSRP